MENCSCADARAENAAAQALMHRHMRNVRQKMTNANTSLRMVSHIHAQLSNALMGKDFIKTSCTATQTEDSKPRKSPLEQVHTRWLWLLALRIEMLSNQEDQDPGSTAKVLAPGKVDKRIQCEAEMASVECMTMVETEDRGPPSDEQVWWTSCVARAEEVVSKGLDVMKKSRQDEDILFAQWMTDPAILIMISEVYEEKVVSDYLCRERQQQCQKLPSFLWGMLLAEHGCRESAAAALTIFVASLLRAVRIHPLRSNSSLVPPARHRMVLFARFLGFTPMDGRGKDCSAIDVDGLETYLVMLAAARQGECPLLEAGVKRMKADVEVLTRIVDCLFQHQESWRVEALKTHIRDASLAAAGADDIESILEMLLNSWQDIRQRWGSRLEALFTASDSDGDGNLDLNEFTAMLQKVVGAESLQNDVLVHRRMYADMCMWPRVDSSVFVKVCRDHSFQLLRVTNETDAELSGGPANMPQKVKSVLDAAMIAVRANANILNRHPAYLDMMFRWTFCQRLIAEAKSLHVASLVMHQATHWYQRIMASMRRDASDKD